MVIDINQIKELREETSAGISDCRMALEESGGDMVKAKEWLRKRGLEKAEKKEDRVIRSGLVYAYVHGHVYNSQGGLKRSEVGRIGAMVEGGCETDFVAKTDDFQNLCKEIAMQVASMAPENVKELLEQDYIRDSKKTIKELVKEVIGKLGEKITVERIARFEVGK